MAVECTKCGEELLGSVNRCWNCGTEFEAHAGPANMPPVRRSPVVAPLAASLDAQVVDDEPAEEEEAVPSTSEGSAATARVDSAPKRRGSPFSTGHTPLPGRQPRQTDSDAAARPEPPSYPTNAGAIAGAFLAFPLGLAGLVLAFFFPLGALILSAFGIAMGSWGLYSRRRGVAIAGLLLCCIAVALGGFNGAVELYAYLHNGMKPWDSAAPISGP